MQAGRISEYDAFGPWVYPLTDAESIPRLFRPYAERIAGSLLALKIPRDLERRNATPDMDLYDAVLAVFPDRLLYLARRERDGRAEVDETAVLLDRIDRLTRETFLLLGCLTVHAGGTSVSIPYNTVSDALMREAFTLIRSMLPRRETGVSPFAALPSLVPATDFMEFGFVSLCLGAIREYPRLNLVAYQPFLEYGAPRMLKSKILTAIAPKRRLRTAFAVLRSDTDLMVVTQTHSARRDSLRDYAYSETFMPLASVESVTAADFAAGASSVRISGRGTEISLLCDGENPYAASLRGLPGA